MKTLKVGIFLFMFFLLLIILSPYVYPQQTELPFEHFSVDQGMPTVTSCILQDRIGYLWFATNSGLYKYDGYNFTSYKHDLDDTTSIIDNTLTTLYEDKSGIFWVGTWLGLEKFDCTKNTFNHYKLNSINNATEASNNIWSICEDKYGMLWIGTSDGLFKFDKATEKFTSLRHDSTDPGSISDNQFGVIHQSKDGSLWFGTQVGLDRFDFKTNKFIHYWNDPSIRNKLWYVNSKYRINKIFEDDSGILWLGTSGGLVEFNPKAKTFFHYMFNPKNPQNVITSICQDAVSKNLWLATWNGLFTFDKKSKKFTSYNKHDENFIYSERSGTLWIGTNTDIRKLNRTKQPFKKYQLNDIALAVSNGNEGILWIFTYNGWKKFDIKKEKFIPYSFGKGYLFYVWNFGSDLSIRREEGGLFIQDTLGNITFSLDPTLNWEEYLNSASFGWKGNKGYWGGFNNGDLDFWDPKTNRVLKIKNLKQRIYWIYEDTFGLLWAATYMGKLFCYNQAKDTLIEFITDSKNISSISGRVINQIFEDKKGRLWFATNNGLNRLERSTNSFIRFTDKNGLPSNNVLGILEDDHGYLWLNTSKGISKFSAEGGSASGGDTEKNHFKNYDVSYGLELTADAWYGVGSKTRNGVMYFAGARGITCFHPDSIKDNPFIPPVVITSFKKFDKFNPLSEKIHLPYDENFISFEFVALSYISPERNQYAYKMEGLDKDWVYSGTRRYASYPNLDPGEYVFRVKGSNNDGVWNEAGTSVLIIISPPWWKTTWAYILYSILILSAIYFTWKMQVKRIKIGHEYEMSRFEAEKLHEVDEMKSRFFANISHEFRTPLTLILGPAKQIIERIKDERTRDELKVIHKNANRLLGLVNQLLDLSKLESGNMKLQTTPQNIIPLLKALLQSFCSYAERKRITLKFNSEEDEIIAYIDKDKIEKIITY